MLLFFVSCLSDHMLTNKIVEERYIYDTAYVEVIIEVEKEVVVEVEVDKPLGKLSLRECGLVIVYRARREGRSASGRHGEQVLCEVAV